MDRSQPSTVHLRPMERLQPVLALGVRTLVGTLLGLALGVTGVGVGWGLFVFFGASTHTTLMILLNGGAGLGAAMGAFLAWLRLDNNSPASLGATALVVLAVGLAGAWGGFTFGSKQEVPCCAGPAITPLTYTVLGAVLGSNAAGLVLGIADAARHLGIHRHSAPRAGTHR